MQKEDVRNSSVGTRSSGAEHCPVIQQLVLLAACGVLRPSVQFCFFLELTSRFHWLVIFKLFVLSSKFWYHGRDPGVP